MNSAIENIVSSSKLVNITKALELGCINYGPYVSWKFNKAVNLVESLFIS